MFKKNIACEHYFQPHAQSEILKPDLDLNNATTKTKTNGITTAREMWLFYFACLRTFFIHKKSIPHHFDIHNKN